jgi:endo-alpha-1,4-polygalactosaminidase (GH114 family)
MMRLLICLFVVGCSEPVYTDKIDTGFVENTCSHNLKRHKENGFWVYDIDYVNGQIVKCKDNYD